MNIELAKFLVEAAENFGIEADLREGYSGRGMCGQETCGIVVDNELELISAILQYIKDNIGENISSVDWLGGKLPKIERLRLDNMGRRIIIY